MRTVKDAITTMAGLMHYDGDAVVTAVDLLTAAGQIQERRGWLSDDDFRAVIAHLDGTTPAHLVQVGAEVEIEGCGEHAGLTGVVIEAGTDDPTSPWFRVRIAGQRTVCDSSGCRLVKEGTQ